MNVDRAKKIIDSEEKFHVQLDGRSIWIDSIDSNTQMATVHVEDEMPIKSKTVNVNELMEV
jgi:H-type small acid-soluble spore protein